MATGTILNPSRAICRVRQWKLSVSVQIWFGQWERVFDQFKPQFPLACNDYLHDIKSKKDIRIVEHAQPSERATRNSLPFCAVDCFEWTPEIFARARLYFYEYQRVVVAAHNIDFAAAAPPKIAEEDLVTATLEVSAC
jgi:hypothetical protein